MKGLKVSIMLVLLFISLILFSNNSYAYWVKNQNITSYSNFSFLGEENPNGEAHLLGHITDAGDFNGDGYNDMLLSAPEDTGNGYVFLVYGGYDITSTWSMGEYVRKPADHVNHSWSGSSAGNTFGRSTSGGFDFNNDGYDDIVIGSPLNDDSATDAGKVYLILGGTYWDSAGWQHGTNTNASWVGGGASDGLGYAVSQTGDFNNDGYDDIVIVAPEDDDGGNNAGTAYIIYGRQNVSTIGFNCAMSNSSCYNATLYGEVGADYLGIMSVSTRKSLNYIGDYNNDGYGDFAIGAGRNDEGTGNNAGQIYVVLGRPTVSSGVSIGTVANASFWGEADGNYIGEISKGADVNNDGYDDFLIGSRLAYKAYLILGNSYYSMDNDLINIPNSFLGKQLTDETGTSVSLGDIDNNGYADILIGAPSNDDGGADTGKAYILMRYDNIVNYGQNFPIHNTSDASFYGEAPSDRLAYYARAYILNDLNNDTYREVVLSAPFNDHPYSIYDGVDDGEVYVILGNPAPIETYCNGKYKVGNTWRVNSLTYCSNEVINLKDNLVVQNNGNLIFSNITLRVNNAYDNEHFITINSGGRFETSNNTILNASDVIFEYYLDAQSGSEIVMDKTTVEEAGNQTGYGIKISSTYANITNSNFNNNYYALYFTSTADYPVVTNTTFKNNTHGITLNSDYATLTNNTFNGNVIGCYISGSSYSNLSNSNVHDNIFAGINLLGSANITIRDMNIYDNDNYGVFLNTSSSDITLYNNTVYGNINEAFYLLNVNGVNVIIDNNNFTSTNTDSRIEMYGSSNISIINNIINVTSASNGLYIEYSNYLLVDNNTFGGESTSNSRLFYLRNSTYVSIYNNKFSNSNEGIYLFASAGAVSDNIISINNTLYNIVSAYISQSDINNHLISNNRFYNISGTAVKLSSGLNTFLINNYFENNVLSLDNRMNATIYNNTFNKDTLSIKLTISNDSYLINNLIENSTNAVKVETVSIDNFYNSTISNISALDVTLVTGAYLRFENVTFNKSSVSICSTCRLNVTWYFCASVKEMFTDNPIENATVKIYDYQSYPFGSPQYTLISNINGSIDIVVLVEYVENATTRLNYTPHTLLASKTGYETNESIVDMSCGSLCPPIYLYLEKQTQLTPTPEEPLTKIKLDTTPDNPIYQKYDPYAFHPEETRIAGFPLTDIAIMMVSAIGLSMFSAYIIRKKDIKNINKRVRYEQNLKR